MKKGLPGSNIRLFLAVFFLFSFLNSLFGELGILRVFNPENIPGVVISLLITIYLFRSYIKTIKFSPKKSQNKVTTNENTFEEEITKSKKLPDMGQDEDSKFTNGYNPVNDNEGVLARIFRGKTDRY